jgi:hypothetical protein
VPILYIVQELTVRFEIVSAKGHAELNKDHFGRGWACLSVTTIGIGDIPAIYARRPTGSLLEERYAFRCTINNGLKPEQFSTSAIRWAWGSAISPRGDMPKYRVPLLARRFGITVTVHSSHLRRTWAVTSMLISRPGKFVSLGGSRPVITPCAFSQNLPAGPGT